MVGSLSTPVYAKNLPGDAWAEDLCATKHLARTYKSHVDGVGSHNIDKANEACLPFDIRSLSLD